MKKVLSLVLVLVLTMGFAVVARAEDDDDSDAIYFDPTLTSIMDYSASEWFSSSTNRALLTVMLITDLSTSDAVKEISFDTEKLAHMLVNGTYVGKDELLLFVGGYVDDTIIIITYMPVIDTATVIPLDNSAASSSIVKLLMESTRDDGVKENDIEDIVELAKAINDAMSD